MIKKSCTTWDIQNLVHWINYLSTGAGFLPSTVGKPTKKHRTGCQLGIFCQVFFKDLTTTLASWYPFYWQLSSHKPWLPSIQLLHSTHLSQLKMWLAHYLHVSLSKNILWIKRTCPHIPHICMKDVNVWHCTEEGPMLTLYISMIFNWVTSCLIWCPDILRKLAAERDEIHRRWGEQHQRMIAEHQKRVNEMQAQFAAPRSDKHVTKRCKWWYLFMIIVWQS